MKENINYHRIKTAMEYIVANFKQQPSIKELATQVHLSEYHFLRIFKDWAGVTPKKFLQYITLNELKRSIENTNNILELSENTGLSSQSRVYELFINIESVTPQEYKTKGFGIEIEYGIHLSPFGPCLIANTKRGICAIEFIDHNQEQVIKQLKQKWQNASVINNQESTSKLADLVFNNKKEPIKALLFGTKFQIKVWEALLKIPSGFLTSYSNIAAQIGNPKANRAVGSTIGKNNIAYLIPCHRVVRNLGDIGEYKWGSGRKLSIIGYEKAKFETIKE